MAGCAQTTLNAPGVWQVRDSSDAKSVLSAIDFVDDKVGWAVGLNSLLHTSDGGKSWTGEWKLPQSFWLNSVAALSPDVILAAGMPYGHKGPGILLRTENGGQTAQALAIGTPGAAFHSLVFRRDNKTGYVVSTLDGLMKTRDGGKTWNVVEMPQRPTRAFIAARGTLALPDDQTIYLGGDDTLLLHSGDDGATWDTIALPEAAKAPHRQFLWVRFVDAKRGWVAPFGNDIWETSDGGQNWKKSAVPGVPFFQNAKNGWAIDASSISRSSDGGQSWTDKVTFDVPRGGLSAIAFTARRAYVSGGGEGASSFVADRLLPGLKEIIEPQKPVLRAPIPIRFALTEPGVVTLVVEDATGKRVRNIVSETPFPAGANVVYWDGLDESGRINESRNGIYDVQGKLVAPGAYQVRGLVHKPLDLRYEFTIYNAAQVPWRTADRASQWLTNHSPPSAILWLPPGVAPTRAASPATFGQLLVGSKVSEGGSGLAWIDTDGRKLNGQEWVGGVWTGATHIARDVGENPVAGVYAYTGASWLGDVYSGGKPELRLHEIVTPDEKRATSGAWVNGVWDASAQSGRGDARMGTGEDRRLLSPNFVFPHPIRGEESALAGLAVRNGVLVASLPTLKQLMFVDARARKIIGAASLEDPRGVAFDAQGRLLALSGNRLLRFALDPTPTAQDGKIVLPPAQVLVDEGLEDPQVLALDGAGNIYISNRGKLHQVKAFDAAGKFLRAIGKAGVPKVGPYDAERMNNPYGLTTAQSANGEQLWVAEEDFQPKRLSVWSLDGKLLRAFYGPTIYGGGGSLDPGDKSRFFHDGIEFQVDWKTGENRPVNIYHRTQDGELAIPAMFAKRPETPVRVADRLYVTNAYTGNPTGGVPVGGVWMMRNGIAKLVAAAGHTGSWPVLQGIGRDNQNFSVRWSGQIQAPTTGRYTFTTLADDGVRLWVDGKQLIDNWKSHGVAEDNGAIELEAGRRTDILLEYVNRNRGGAIKLQWSGPGQERAVISSGNLFADAKATSPGGLRAHYFNSTEPFGEFRTTQVDTAIDFDYNTAPPAALLRGTEQFRDRLPAGVKTGDQLSFVWSDGNDNGKVEPSEIAFRAGWQPGGGVVVGPDLAITLPDSWRLEPNFTGAGVPRYDLSAAKKRFDWLVHHPTSGGGQILDLPDGYSVAVAGPIQGFRTVPTGTAPTTKQAANRLMWTYPNQWPGLHASHYARLAKAPGEVLGATRLLGLPITLAAASATDKTPFQVWGINGNMGQGYLMTSDGLFVATLFKDHRQAKPWPDKAVRGMPLNDVSMGGESFFNTLTQSKDGQVYVQTGNHIVRVNGLESLKRLPTQKISVTPQLLAQAQNFFVQRDVARQQAKGASSLKVALRAQAPSVDGKLDEWKDEDFVAIDVKTKVAATVSGDTLYLAYKTGYRDLLKNQIESLPLAFKTGGALDLQIGTNPNAPANRQTPTEGDQRLLITRGEGDKVVAVRYRAVVAGEKEPVPFASPTRTVSFDRVDEVGSQIRLVQGTAPIEEFHEGNVFGNRTDKYEGTAYEVAIPLALLDLRPVAGQSLRGDLGVLIGNGFQTIQRVYWNNKATALVSDIPGEAMLTPQLWGQWKFEAAP